MHELFEVWSPDEVAECLPGVNSEDYAMLWELTWLVPRPTECNDNRLDRCLGTVWDKIPADAQERLNKLAEQADLLFGNLTEC